MYLKNQQLDTLAIVDYKKENHLHDLHLKPNGDLIIADKRGKILLKRANQKIVDTLFSG